MAEIQAGGGGGHKKGGKKRGKKLSTRVDFTPLVDLGFLLITFFMLTTSMNKPQTMEINMPVKEDNMTDEDQTKVKESQAMTILLTKENKIVYYFMKDGQPETPQVTNFGKGGIRAVLLQENRARNSAVDSIPVYRNEFKENKLTEDEYRAKVSAIKSYKNGLIVIIKADDESKYKNLVDILDEMNICNIGRYAIVDITPVELEMLDKTPL